MQEYKDKDLYRVRVVKKKNDVHGINILLRKLTKKTATVKKQSIRVPFNSMGKKQLCVFKTTYSKKKESHNAFINIYLPQKNKNHVLVKPELYGSDSIAEYKKNMSDLHFKFIISPESQSIDQKVLTKTFIASIEKKYECKLFYLAAKHMDTDHQHTHILINGVDKTGKKLRFTKEDIQLHFREILQTISTHMIGERTQEQIKHSQNAAIFACRWTKNDLVIKNLLQNKNQLPYVYCNNFTFQQRLNFLESLELAQKTNDGGYTLSPDWEETLKAQGRYNTFLATRKEFANLTLYESNAGTISGTIQKIITMDNEEIWNNAVIIQSHDKQKTWYVPTFFEASTKLVGRTVDCVSIPNQKGKLMPKLVLHKSKSLESGLIEN